MTEGAQAPLARIVAVCLVLLTAFMLLVSLSLGKAILAPIILALVLGVVVSPVAKRLAQFGVPRVISAAFCVGVTMVFIAAVILTLGPVVDLLARRLPEITRELSAVMNAAAQFLQGIEELSEEIERSVGTEADATAEIPTIADALWMAPNFGAQFLIFVGTLFFFVLTREELYDRTGDHAPALRRADRTVSKYFAAVTLVNTALGVATGIVMGLIGMEFPVLWGLAAAILNFIIYLGPIIMMVSLLIAGIILFDGGFIVVPALAFFLLNATEAQFLTPFFVGQRLSLNPLLVFIAIVFGLWLWGPVGAIVALPLSLWVATFLAEEFQPDLEKNAQ